MSLLKKLFGRKQPPYQWGDDAMPCPTCGKLVRALTNQPTLVLGSALDTRQVRIGYRCRKCRALYHGSCAPHQREQPVIPPGCTSGPGVGRGRGQRCFCGSDQFSQLPIDPETPPCFGATARENCKGCGLLKKFCRCDHYENWERERGQLIGRSSNETHPG